MTLPDPDGEWTEAVDANIPRVDLVGKAANGSPGFLLMKQESTGLLSDDFVRDLITKADQEPAPMTITGTPGQIAAMIASAPVRKSEPEEPAVTETALAKDADSLLADPDPKADGNPTDPGSPAWESIDAETARGITSTLAEMKYAVEMLADREEQEVVIADSDDIGNVFDLEDASCAIDAAISLVAPYAVGEQAEVDLGAMAMAKAVSEADTGFLKTIYGLAPLRKAGRTLSAANEAAIRGAVDSLQKVLASLPVAADDAAPVAKEKEIDVTEAEKDDAVAKAVEEALADVAKAKGDPMTPVYDAAGKLVGMVDATDLIPIAPASAPAAPADDAPSEPVAPAAAAVAADPDAPAAAVIPGTDTVQAPVAKSDPEDIVKAESTDPDALKETLALLAKQIDGQVELAEIVKGLQERVEHIGRMPDDRKSPRLNGATGTPGLASRDGQDGDLYADLKKSVEEAADPVTKKAAQNALFYAQLKDRVTSH